jgi:hypothetical protein
MNVLEYIEFSKNNLKDSVREDIVDARAGHCWNVRAGPKALKRTSQ